MFDIEVKIVKHFGVLKKHETGWCREINKVSWNGADPKYDVRDWSPDHTRMSRGITLTDDEMDKLIEAMGKARKESK